MSAFLSPAYLQNALSTNVGAAGYDTISGSVSPLAAKRRHNTYPRVCSCHSNIYSVLPHIFISFCVHDTSLIRTRQTDTHTERRKCVHGVGRSSSRASFVSYPYITIKHHIHFRNCASARVHQRETMKQASAHSAANKTQNCTISSLWHLVARGCKDYYTICNAAYV